jgi:hypothetical protein
LLPLLPWHWAPAVGVQLGIAVRHGPRGIAAMPRIQPQAVRDHRAEGPCVPPPVVTCATQHYQAAGPPDRRTPHARGLPSNPPLVSASISTTNMGRAGAPNSTVAAPWALGLAWGGGIRGLMRPAGMPGLFCVLSIASRRILCNTQTPHLD